MDALRLLMLKALDEIAHRVWRAVNNLPEEFDRGKTLYMGADGSPTSAIDKTAEDAILNAVDDLDLKVNILSEEAGYIDRGYSETLVVDPVDGTHNATLGLPFYTVSLAVGKNSLQGITQAVVKNLVTGDVYTAEKGEGSRLNNKPIHVKEFNTTFPSLLCYVGHHVPQDTFDKVVKCATNKITWMCICGNVHGSKRIFRCSLLQHKSVLEEYPRSRHCGERSHIEGSWRRNRRFK